MSEHPPPPPGPPGPPSPPGPPVTPGTASGYRPRPRNSGKSIAVLVLGIVGLVSMCLCFVGLIPSVVALALAPGAKREIRSSAGHLTGESFIKAGVICSWVALVLGVVYVVVLIVSGGSFSVNIGDNTESF